jgi:polysaccharide pyruvyl transferase WcaK-like protein
MHLKGSARELTAEPLRQALADALRDRRGRPGRALLLGNYGNGNSGDEAILAGLIDLSSDPTRLTVVTRNPKEIARLHNVAATRTVSMGSIVSFLRSDALCVGGGGMFGRGLPPLVGLLPLVLLVGRFLRKEIYFLALGAYSDTPEPVRTLLRLVARVARAVTVRDEESVQMLNDGMARGVRPVLVPDPAVELAPAPPAKVLELLASHADRPLVVSIKALPDTELLDHSLSVLAQAVRACALARKAPVVLLCLSARADYGLGPEWSDPVLADLFCRKADLPYAPLIVGPDLPPRLAKGVVAQARGVVGMRLHAQIFAVATGAPLIGLTFEAKTESWLRAHQVPSLPVRDMTAENLTDLMLQTIP